MALACPQCKQILTVPQPLPEKMPCPNCRAIIKFAPAKSAAPAPPPPAASAAPASAQTATAKLVAGFELQRELARGGLGIVHLAYHPHLKHYRAIKRPQPRADLDNDVLLGRFRRETEALGALESKHIIRAYDAGADADGPYLVTEYLDGESLSSLVARHRQLPVSEACELIRQVALGLQTAHEAGMVHRDIKPSNLMLTRASAGTARTVVIDWGLVKRTGDSDAIANRLTKIHTELGTLDYIPPEQIRDPHTVDIRADIYSLGATLYYLLAGRPPFQGRTDAQKQLAQTREEFPPLEQLRPDVPANVLNVLKKMVKKNPAERYQTPAEVAAALQPFACAEPHRMLALLAPVPIQSTTPSDTARILDEKTQLAPAPPSASFAPSPEGQSGSQHLIIWGVLGAAGLLAALIGVLVIVIVIAFAFKGDGGKKDPEVAKGQQPADDDAAKKKAEELAKSKLPKVLIDEDFRKAYEKRQSVPDGWKSDEFTIVKVNELFALHPSAPGGSDKAGSNVASVQVPLSSPLHADFSIQGVFHMDNPYFAAHHTFTVSLENRSKGALLTVAFDCDGKVFINKDARSAPANYKPFLPTAFHVKREGTKIRVLLDDNPAVEKNLEDAPEYDTLRLIMTAGKGNGGRPLRLHGLKVVALP
jgi:serine/threonine protein kinase